MDDNELALYFAANKENEELREKLKNYEELESQISRLEINLNSFVISSGNAELHRRSLDNTILDKDSEIQALKSFIIELDKYPKFWARSYKILIDRFIKEQDIEY